MEDEGSPGVERKLKRTKTIEAMAENCENVPTGRASPLGMESKGKEARIPFRKISSCSSASTSSGGSKKSLRDKQKMASGRRIKCVLVGDCKTGKSALVQSFLSGQSSLADYVATTQDEYVYNPGGDNTEEDKMTKPISLHICDTGGQNEMDRLRPLSYSQVQVVVICFSVMSPSSFANVTLKWLPEVKRHCMVKEDPENPLKLLLVGTQSDLRSNMNMLLKLMDDGQAPISETQALRLAHKIGALKYIESSVITRSNVDHIFNLAIKYGEGKAVPRLLSGLDMDSTLHGKFLPNITERKLLFWRRWRVRQTKSSKVKRLVLLPCMF